MGLDVYLEWWSDFERDVAKLAKYEKESEAIWKVACHGKDYEAASEDEKKVWKSKRDIAAKKLGLVKNEYGSWGISSDCKRKVNMQSEIHSKEDCFKIGYFRSSYNEGGINSVLRSLNLPDLYGLFQFDENQKRKDFPYWQPDWDASRIRVTELIKKLKVMSAGEAGKYTVHHIRGMNTEAAKSSADAMSIFLKELESHKKNTKEDFMEFSNIHGEFWLGKSPAKLRAIINAKPQKDFFSPDMVSECYIILETDGDESHLKWYIDALEIVLETIDYVLAQDDTENYVMYWSG